MDEIDVICFLIGANFVLAFVSWYRMRTIPQDLKAFRNNLTSEILLLDQKVSELKIEVKRIEDSYSKIMLTLMDIMKSQKPPQ